MPRYTHPGPLDIRLDLAAGDARVTASGHDDVVVRVDPRDPGSAADARAAGEVEVSLDGDRLDVRAGGGRRPRHRGAVVVTMTVPEGSRLRARSGAGDLVTEGPLADCSVRSGAGDVELGPIAGAAVLTIGRGSISVGAVGSVVAKTAVGAIRVGRVASGDADLRTAAGDIEVGIADGSSAHLDVRASRGTVLQELEQVSSPPAEGPRVSVRARTGTGDVVVRRA